MSELIYVSSVLFFSYVIYVVLGEQITARIKKRSISE